jgi:L-cysteine/cystine lyase
VDAAALRAEFPVFERFAYLNAGSAGPLPAAAVAAAVEVAQSAAAYGRTQSYFDELVLRRERLRTAYAALVGASADDVAITTCTSEGVVRVLHGLDLRAGDEVLTSDTEHAGLLGPLHGLRRRRGVALRAVALHDIADAVGPRTRLVACSHVSWVTGSMARLPADVPVLVDGAQSIGAIPVDVETLGCTFFAGSGQKWLCGPVGTGMLWVSAAWSDRLAPLGPTLVNIEDAQRGGLEPRPGARAHDTFAAGSELLAAALAAHAVLAEAGWHQIHARASTLASRLAHELAQRGRRVATRDATTLVAWEDEDPVGLVGALRGRGVIVRHIPRTRLVRASVGAWNDEGDLERLLAALGRRR